MRIFLLLFSALCMLGCSTSNKDCKPKQFNFGNQQGKALGCLENNLEYGKWQFFSDTNLIETGNFENGIRTGEWHYPKNPSDSVINWEAVHKLQNSLHFAIPSLLKKTDEDSTYIKFSNLDTSKLFNIVLSIYPIEKSKKPIDQYYKQGEEEIINQGWTFTSQKSNVKSTTASYYFNEYRIETGGNNEFRVLNIYRLIEDSLLFEISCRFDSIIESSARIIFFSIVTNSFYKKVRFLNPFEEIVSIK